METVQTPPVATPMPGAALEQTVKAIVHKDDKSPDVSTRQAMKVEFLDTCVRIDLGKGFTKLVEYTDFHEAFTRMMGAVNTLKSEKKNSLQLPNNVFMINTSSTTIDIGCYYPGGVRNITYMEDTRPRVYPNIIILHTLSAVNRGGWNVANSLYMCTDLPLNQLNRKFYARPSNADRVWLLPFSNMYENAQMCMGANQLPRNLTATDLRPLNAYFDVIFNSPFNNDLGLRALPRDAQEQFSVQTWFRHLGELADRAEPFPYRYLSGFTARTA